MLAFTILHYTLILADDADHPLGNKWQDSECYQFLIDELNPKLDKAIDKPLGTAPKFATNPLTQVRMTKMPQYCTICGTTRLAIQCEAISAT